MSSTEQDPPVQGSPLPPSPLQDITDIIPGVVLQARYTVEGPEEFLYVSQGAEEVFGVSREALMADAKLFLTLCHPDDAAKLKQTITRVVEDQSDFKHCWRIITPEGQTRWVRVSGRHFSSAPSAASEPYASNDKTSAIRVGVFTDVTHERVLESQLKDTNDRLEQIMRILPGGLYQLKSTPSGENTLLYANSKFWTLLGFPADSPNSAFPSVLKGIIESDREIYKTAIQQAIHSIKQYPLRLRYQRPDNQKVIPIEIHNAPTPIPDSEATLLTGLVLDVSKQVAMEEDLLQQKIRAEEASIAKSSFLANMSHEMRTPLNGILGYAQLLTHDMTLTGQHAKNLHSLRQCSEHLLAVISDVLDMARIESGHLEIDNQPMALYHMLDQVESVVAPLANSKGLRFQLNTDENTPAYILSDATRLRQVLINLLNNAVKFTDKGGIELKVSIEGEQLTFTVSDTGSGIPANQQAAIFQPFERQDDHKALEGTGLGLAICRHIMDALEGSLTMTSQEGVGSTFTMTLPFQEASAIDDHADTAHFKIQPLKQDPPPSILVVDDRASNRDILKQWLNHSGFHVETAENGQQALELLKRSQQHPFDLLLVDLRMPVMGGMELVAVMQKDDTLHKIPCVAISASVFPAQTRKVLMAGFCAFLPKPCSLSALFETVYEQLGITQENQPDVSEPSLQPETRQQALPAAERDKMLEMIDMGDIEGLMEWIQTLGETPELHNITTQLSHCLEDLDMENFRRLLQDG